MIEVIDLLSKIKIWKNTKGYALYCNQTLCSSSQTGYELNNLFSVSPADML
jgi:hypothetical protein